MMEALQRRCEVKCPYQDPETCKLEGAIKEGCRKNTELGMSFKKKGKCPGCGEVDVVLYSYEGTYDDPDDMMCEGCIDEFHARVHEAEDAMADMVDTDAMADEEWAAEELGYGEEYY